MENYEGEGMGILNSVGPTVDPTFTINEFYGTKI